MNSRSVAIFAVVVAVIVGAAYWFINGENAAHYTAPPPDVKKAPAQENTASSEPSNPPSRFIPEPAFVPDKVPVAPGNSTVVMTEDDRKIDDALNLYKGNTDQDHLNTAQALITLLPSLTKDGQVEAASHISNLLPDEAWGNLNHIWRNPSFNPDVLEVFETDLMNREDKVKLPALLEAIRIPNHPARDNAMSTLQVFLDEDYGDNVAKWETAMKAFLKKAEDEEREANAPVNK